MRVAHISDLHFGRHDVALAEGLAADIGDTDADLVVVSGDFTQVGSEAEFQTARTFLDRLARPIFAVPGNHDVPAHNPFRRFLNPYGHYRRYICDELEPFLLAEGVAIAGLKTSRRMRLELNWANGSISRRQLAHLEARFAEVPAGVTRVVVAHHPLLEPEADGGSFEQKRVKRADLALATFADLGVRLVLSGHFHLSYVREHARIVEVTAGEPSGPREAAAGPIIVAQASSTISTRLRGEANAYNVVDIDGDEIVISVREWSEGKWIAREKAVAEL